MGDISLKSSSKDNFKGFEMDERCWWLHDDKKDDESKTILACLPSTYKSLPGSIAIKINLSMPVY